MKQIPFTGLDDEKRILKSYLTGFVLALSLTLIPFGLVLSDVLPRTLILSVIFLAALVQILVHLHYFLHLDISSDERWNLLSILFTGIIVVIMVGGTIWILYNLSDSMMPH
jgi:cytochrome o ubiquinol oxidase operon protein cyoD